MRHRALSLRCVGVSDILSSNSTRQGRVANEHRLAFIDSLLTVSHVNDLQPWDRLTRKLCFLTVCLISYDSC
jgi:hypothetical protein